MDPTDKTQLESISNNQFIIQICILSFIYIMF